MPAWHHPLRLAPGTTAQMDRGDLYTWLRAERRPAESILPTLLADPHEEKAFQATSFAALVEPSPLPTPAHSLQIPTLPRPPSIPPLALEMLPHPTSAAFLCTHSEAPTLTIELASSRLRIH